MSQEFNESAKVHMTRDQLGHVRDLLNTEEPFLSTAQTAQLAAKQYLEKFGSLLGISGEHMHNLGLPPEDHPGEAGVEYRLLEEITQFDATTVVFSQTYFGVQVWEAGVAVHVLANPLRVMSAQSTLHHDLHMDLPRKAAIERLEQLTEESLALSLGLTEKEKDSDRKKSRDKDKDKSRDKYFRRSSLKIERREWYIYRYDAAQRVHVSEPISGEHRHFTHSHRYPELPPLAGEIHDGGHYLVSAVYFVLDTSEIADLHWVALIEAETLSVLMLRAFVDSVNGFVFTQDPVTLNGGPLPNATDAQLNPVRSSVLLTGLVAPVGGNYALTGDIIQVRDLEPPPVAPPIEPIGTDFNFNTRTDNFSAVNAYYHCDRFFRLVQSLGFDLPTYFGGTIFPTGVDHRGSISTPTGQEINAHCLGTGSFGILRTTFMLADLTNVAQPIGLADDWRVVLHELGGHGILYNHVNGPNFKFSHSAGDSFGAVLNDYDSQAPDRFVTFPWVNIGRRHDRTPAAGWGWNGATALPPSPSYGNEQILCTTHFRIYRSIGGDSSEVPMRVFAGDYVAYLILRTVGSLTPATTPADATAYCSGLMSADFGNWTSAQQTGGCYWKVIRWAFEKQGSFQPVAMPKPNNNIGDPPNVDVYIDDGRHGEYQYEASGAYPYLQRFWETTDIWNRHHPDGQAVHQTPIVGRPNYAYVVVKNRGTQAANNITVRGWHCRPSAGLVWPDDWKPMSTNSLKVPTLASGAQVVVGPFEWHPNHHGHECMFMDTGAAGDLSNNDSASLLPSATGPTPLWRMVPCDNNQGLRAVIPVPGGGHREALVRAFYERRFWASNPTPNTVKMEVRAVLPTFLTSRGWLAYLDNPGGGSFSLGPRDTREMHPRLISGQDFTELQVVAAGRVAIEFIVLADGLVVGGLTYVLDPHLKEPAHEEAEEKEHDERDEKECHEPEKHEHYKCCHHETCQPQRCCKHETCDECDQRERQRRIKFEIELD